MADEDHVTRGQLPQRQRHHLVGAIADLRHALAAGTAVRPDQPIGFVGADLCGGQTFVATVVPFGEALGGLIDVQSGKLSGHLRASPRAAEHQWVLRREIGQRRAGRDGLAMAHLGQFQLGASGVPTVSGPLGFTVAQQQKSVLLDPHARRFCPTPDMGPRLVLSRGKPCQYVGVTGMRILAVANQKGGVAKTTTVASLGAAMAELGRRVLLVDLDPQGCLTFSLGQDPDKLPVSVHEVLLGEVEPNAALVTTEEGMTLLPANIDLAGAEAMLLMRAGREYALQRALAKLEDEFDVVVIDCPPSLGVLTLNGLTAAGEVIVPLQCETLAHRGVGQFLRTVNDVQQITNPKLTLLGALPTLYDSRTTHSRDVLLDIADRYDLPVLAPPIPRTVRFAEASASGASVIAARKNKGAQAYRQLAEALLKYWKTGKKLPTFTPEV